MDKLLLTTCVLGLAACGSNSLTDPAQTKTWANSASALGVYANVNDPLAFADAHYTFPDPACPVTHDDGTTVTITGGCTDSAGTGWVGTATIVRSGGDRALTLDHYGKTGSTATGTFNVHATSPTDHGFDASYRVEGGVTTTFTYSGTVTGTWGTATVWNGSGTIERSGIVAPQGSVNASTTDERYDSSVCNHQAVSGSTTLQTGGHTAVITYDGATSCSEAATVRWSVDGADRGTLDGVTCSTIPGRDAPAGPMVAVLGVAALALARRRAR